MAQGCAVWVHCWNVGSVKTCWWSIPKAAPQICCEAWNLAPCSHLSPASPINNNVLPPFHMKWNTSLWCQNLRMKQSPEICSNVDLPKYWVSIPWRQLFPSSETWRPILGRLCRNEFFVHGHWEWSRIPGPWLFIMLRESHVWPGVWHRWPSPLAFWLDSRSIVKINSGKLAVGRKQASRDV